MDLVMSPGFSLEIEDLPLEALRPLSFEGREGANELYAFDVLVLLRDLEPRVLEDCLARPLTLTFAGSGQLEQRVHGVLGGVAAEGHRQEMDACYALRIVPTLWLEVWAKGDKPCESVYLTADADGRARVLARIKLKQTTQMGGTNLFEKPDEPPGALERYAAATAIMKKTSPGSHHVGVAGPLAVPAYFTPW